jgi:hypothetical protein
MGVAEAMRAPRATGVLGSRTSVSAWTRTQPSRSPLWLSTSRSSRWTDTRRGETFTLTTLNVRLLPDGHLAVKAYGRPIGGGRGGYVPFPVPQTPELTTLIADAATRAAALWAANRGLA